MSGGAGNAGLRTVAAGPEDRAVQSRPSGELSFILEDENVGASRALRSDNLAGSIAGAGRYGFNGQDRKGWCGHHHNIAVTGDNPTSSSPSELLHPRTPVERRVPALPVGV